MNHEMIENQGFKGRASLLNEVERFIGYSPVYYRSNLYMHTSRVNWLCEELIPLARESISNFNPWVALSLPLVHDDPEIITKDVLLSKKYKMTKEEKMDLRKEEIRAINILSKVWPEEVNGINYKNLLYLALNKNTVEAKFVSFVDKFDALCESLHELYAGNKEFYNRGEDNIRPPANGSAITRLRREYFELTPLFSINHPFLRPLIKIYPYKILEEGKLHTLDSVLKKTGLPHYDFWRETIIKHSGKEGLIWLTERKEQ